MKSEIFINELATILDEDIREFAKYLLDEADDYFYTVPASSTGKYHPSYALGEGGLSRHTKALVGIMNSLLSLEQYQNTFSTKEQDLLRVSGLVHDIKKSGNNGSKYTVHEHPILAGEYVLEKYNEMIGYGVITKVSIEDIAYIRRAIESHMGQWNTTTKSSVVLQKPTTEAEKFLHVCDYLASRKFLEYLFDEPTPSTSSLDSIERYIMPFGKYKGMLLLDIAKDDIQYLVWLNSKDGLDTTLRFYINKILNK